MLNSKSTWADFSYSNVAVYLTPDPEQFVVECDGTGLLKNPMFTKPHQYDNHFFLICRVRDGHVKMIREYMNPMKLEYAFWNPMPDLLM